MLNNFSAAYLEQASQQYGNREAIVYRDQSINFVDLHTKARQCASLLVELGLKPRQRVLYVNKDSIEWIIVFHALIMIGCIPMNTNPMLTAAEKQDFIDRGEITAAIGSASLIDALNVDLKIAVDNLDYSAQPCFNDYYIYNHDDFFIMISSSGTTSGKYKIIVHKHDDVHRPIANGFNFTDQSVIACSARLSSGYGLILNAFTVLYHGSKTVLFDMPGDLRHLDKIFNKHQVTHFISLPSNLKILVENDNIHFGEHLQNVYSSAEPTTPWLLSTFQKKFGIELRDSYGQGETAKWHSHSPLILPPNSGKAGSTGVITSLYEYRIVDDTGADVPKGEVGQLLLKNSQTRVEYLNDPDATAKAFKDYWFYTKDMMYEDPDGFFYFVGRADQRVKINEKFVSATEIESKLAKIQEIQDSVIIFEEDEQSSHISVGYIQLKEDHQHLKIHELKSILLKEGVPSHMIPKKMILVRDFERTPTTKKIRAKNILDTHIIETEALG